MHCTHTHCESVIAHGLNFQLDPHSVIFIKIRVTRDTSIIPLLRAIISNRFGPLGEASTVPRGVPPNTRRTLSPLNCRKNNAKITNPRQNRAEQSFLLQGHDTPTCWRMQRPVPLICHHLFQIGGTEEDLIRSTHSTAYNTGSFSGLSLLWLSWKRLEKGASPPCAAEAGRVDSIGLRRVEGSRLSGVKNRKRVMLF